MTYFSINNMLDKIIKYISDMFKEDTINKLSAMRILSAFAVVVPIVSWVVYIFIYGWVEPSDSLAYIVGVGITGKVTQKYVEKKYTLPVVSNSGENSIVTSTDKE